MQEYKIVAFSRTDKQNDILIALLSQLNFESFEEIDENSLNAYILSSSYKKDEIQDVIDSLDNLKHISFTTSILENKNWNAEWEKNFQAINIDGKCQVRAPFHASDNSEYELLIEPKMAFGTGHHATTEMMLTLMLGIDFEDKEVLDFGAGTGILSLLASKKMAKEIKAIDIEQEAYENMLENFALNHCNNIKAICGDISLVPKQKYDIILANVTTNIIEENFNALLDFLHADGEILFSGILNDQSSTIEELARNLKFINKIEQNNWVTLHFKK